MLLVTSVCLLLGLVVVSLGLVVVQLGFLVVPRLVQPVVGSQLRDLGAVDLLCYGLFVVLMTAPESLCYWAGNEVG